VRLHLLVDSKDGRLNGERIRAVIPEWQSASIWFCGPPRFGQALREDFLAHGLPPERFHQELFQMR
jgi:ferredoxin-NADP reductase